MPNRILREGINSSSRVNKLSMGAEVLYRRLMSVADDYGRFHAAARTVIGACWPTCPDRVTDAEIVAWMAECTAGERPLIQVYEVAGAQYLQIQQFGQQMRSKSKFPEPKPMEVIHIADCEQIASKLISDCEQNDSTSRSRRRSRISESESWETTTDLGKGKTLNDDDRRPEYATEKDELAAMVIEATGSMADRRLVDSICEAVEFRGWTMRQYLDDIFPRIGRLKESPRAGFFLNYARSIGSAAQEQIRPMLVPGKCCKWGTLADGSYCGKCETGRELQKYQKIIEKAKVAEA